jgi:hypothetical protein
MCEIDEIKRRLVNPSRRSYGKLTDAKVFDEFVSQNDVFAPIEFVESLEIDNTELPVNKTVIMIKRHCGL